MKKNIQEILIPFNLPEAFLALSIMVLYGMVRGWKMALLITVGAYVVCVALAAAGVKPKYRFRKND